MFSTSYTPYLCLFLVLFVLFLLWIFVGGGDYEFIGLAPLQPETAAEYTGSSLNWKKRDFPRISKLDTIVNDDYIDMTPQVTYDKFDLPAIIDNLPSQARSTENLDPQHSMKNYEGDLSLHHSAVTDHSTKSNLRERINIEKIIKDTESRINVTRGRKRIGAMDGDPPKKIPSVGERICKQTLEAIYGVPFENVREDWFRNPETGRKLELDCYNDDLKIAVEYNGIQHYSWPNFTGQSKEEFIKQRRRDMYKYEYCQKLGIYLIVVPYNVPERDIPSFIISNLPETIQQRIKDQQND